MADAHLDTDNYGPVDAQSGLNRRLFDFSDAFDKIVDYSIEKNVDLVLFAGDAFRVRDPNPTKRDIFDERIGRLAERGIQVVIILGNHDLPTNLYRKSSVCTFKTLKFKNVHLSTKPELLCVDTRSGPVQIATLPYQTASMVLEVGEMKDKTMDEIDFLFYKRLSDLYKSIVGTADHEIPLIGMAHCTIAGSVAGSEREISLGKEIVLPYDTFALDGIEYVALGHVHKHQVIQKGDGPPLVYSGSFERIDFSEREEDKGFVKLSIAKGNTKFAFEKLDVRDMVQIDVTSVTQDPTDEFIEAVKKKAKSIKGAIVKPVITLDKSKIALWDERKALKALKGAYYVLPFKRDIQFDGKPKDIDVDSETDPNIAMSRYLKDRTDLTDEVKDKAAYKLRELHEAVTIRRG